MPPLMILFYFIAEKKFPAGDRLGKAAGIALAATAIWGTLLYRLMLRDSQGPFSYNHNVGFGIMPASIWMWLACRAFLEGVLKAISGMGITTTRIIWRRGPGFWLNAWQASVILLSSAAAAAAAWYFGNRWVKAWVSVFALGIGVYLSIQNVNIGSEHYWYFALVGFVCLLAYAVWSLVERFTHHPHVLFSVICVVYGGYFLVTLENRVFDLGTREDYLRAELDHYPECGANWVNMASVLLETNRPIQEAEHLLAEAKKRNSSTKSQLGILEFKIARKKKEFPAMRQALAKMEGGNTPARIMAEAELDYAMANLDDHDCPEAKRALASAQQIDPTNEVLKKTQKWAEISEKQRPELCRPLNIRSR